MAGITKAERERRRAWMESCDHRRMKEGGWRWYPSLKAFARRIRCEDCPFWYVQDFEDYLAQQDHEADMAGAEEALR